MKDRRRGGLLRPGVTRLDRIEPEGSRSPEAAEQRIRDFLTSRDGTPGYIYLIREPRTPPLYKIGLSRSPARRIRGMQLPPGCVIIHVIRTSDMGWAEKYLHRRYAAERVEDEWFRLSDAQVAEICAISELHPER